MHFRPEFLNRLDEILAFLPLKKEDMQKIVVIQLQQLAKRFAERQVSLNWSDAVVNHLAEVGYDPAFGARPLKRVVQDEVVNMLARAVLEGKIHDGHTVNLDFKEHQVIYTIK